MGLQFVDHEPIDAPVRRKSNRVTEALLEQLKVQPGKWAALKRYEGKNAATNGTAARDRLLDRWRDQGYEFRVTHSEEEDGDSILYGQYLPF